MTVSSEKYKAATENPSFVVPFISLETSFLFYVTASTSDKLLFDNAEETSC